MYSFNYSYLGRAYIYNEWSAGLGGPIVLLSVGVLPSFAFKKNES